MKRALQVDLGLIGYAEAYTLQKRIVAARKADALEDVVLLCEHPHVITQGRNGKREHLLVGEHVLRQKGVEFYETSRWGHHLSWPRADCGLPHPELGCHSAGRGLVRAHAGGGHDLRDRGFWNYGETRRGENRNLGGKRKHGREAGSDRRAHQPLGDLAWICI